MPSRLATARLELRRLAVTDLGDVHRLFADPGHSFSDGPVSDVAVTERWLERRQAVYEGSGFAWYGVRHPTGDLVGTCGILLSERCAPEPEIGYEVARAQRGLGFAKEAAGVVTAAAHAFGVPRLWATVRTTNAPSLRVLAAVGYIHARTETDDRGGLAYYVSDAPPTAPDRHDRSDRGVSGHAMPY